MQYMLFYMCQVSRSVTLHVLTNNSCNQKYSTSLSQDTVGMWMKKTDNKCQIMFLYTSYFDLTSKFKWKLCLTMLLCAATALFRF